MSSSSKQQKDPLIYLKSKRKCRGPMSSNSKRKSQPNLCRSTQMLTSNSMLLPSYA